MRSHVIRILALAAFCAFSLPAMAADIFANQAPAQDEFKDPYSFTGLMFGIGAGLNQQHHEINIPPLTLDGVSADGFYGELFGGGQYQFQNNFVLGGIVGGTLDNTETAIGLAGLGSLSAERDYTWFAALRAGYAVTERAMIYLEPGYRWTQQKVKISAAGGGGSASFSQDYEGMMLAAGLSVLATRNLAVDLYGRHTWYNGASWGVSGLDVEPRELEAGARFSILFFGN